MTNNPVVTNWKWEKDSFTIQCRLGQSIRSLKIPRKHVIDPTGPNWDLTIGLKKNKWIQYEALPVNSKNS
jgi:hypothetical protein